MKSTQFLTTKQGPENATKNSELAPMRHNPGWKLHSLRTNGNF